MPLTNVYAEAHPQGHRIDISWQDEEQTYHGVAIVRRSDRYPVSLNDSDVKDDENNGIYWLVNAGESFSDETAIPEITHYYTLFPYTSSETDIDISARENISGMATAVNGFEHYLKSLLPAIYHRYDRSTDTLANFLKLVGAEVDSIYSQVGVTRDFANIDKTPGQYLPELAEWLAWRLDYQRTLAGQRQEIRNASSIYKRIDLIPTLEAMIKRATGLESQSKEYVHNIFMSNTLPQNNLWKITKDPQIQEWLIEDGAKVESLVSLDYNYEGASSVCQDELGGAWLFYHTKRNNRWLIGYKRSASYLLDAGLRSELEQEYLSSTLFSALQNLGLSFVQQNWALNAIDENRWSIGPGAGELLIERLPTALQLFDLRPGERFNFGPSESLSADYAIQKYPSAQFDDGILWIMWSVYEESRWFIRYRRRDGVDWERDVEFSLMNDTDTIQRREPKLIAVNNSLWLFWFESNNGQTWSIAFSRRVANDWAEPIRVAYRDDSLIEVVEAYPKDLNVFSRNGQIALSWTSQVAVPDLNPYPIDSASEIPIKPLVRKAIRVLVKDNLAFDTSGFGAIRYLPRTGDGNYHDVEPAMVAAESGLTVYFSSNRSNTGWSIWAIDLLAGEFSTYRRISSPYHSQRNPLPIVDYQQGPDDRVLFLFYRSNRPMHYESDSYRATVTQDARYCGSRTLDSRHQVELRREFGVLPEDSNEEYPRTPLHTFDDAFSYTYEVTNNNLTKKGYVVRRDTLVSYLKDGEFSSSQLEYEALATSLQEFVGINNRLVFKTYDTPETIEPGDENPEPIIPENPENPGEPEEPTPFNFTIDYGGPIGPGAPAPVFIGNGLQNTFSLRYMEPRGGQYRLFVQIQVSGESIGRNDLFTNQWNLDQGNPVNTTIGRENLFQDWTLLQPASNTETGTETSILLPLRWVRSGSAPVRGMQVTLIMRVELEIEDETQIREASKTFSIM